MRGLDPRIHQKRSFVQSMGAGDKRAEATPFFERLCPATTAGDIRLRSRSADTPRFCIDKVPRKIEGAGNAGCTPHPRPRVQSEISTRVSHHRYAETPPALPAQWF